MGTELNEIRNLMKQAADVPNRSETPVETLFNVGDYHQCREDGLTTPAIDPYWDEP